MSNLIKSNGNQLLKYSTQATYSQFDGFTTVNPLPTTGVSGASLGLNVNSGHYNNRYAITNGIEFCSYIVSTSGTLSPQGSVGLVTTDSVYIYNSNSFSSTYQGKFYLVADKTWHDNLPTVSKLISVE